MSDPHFKETLIACIKRSLFLIILPLGIIVTIVYATTDGQLLPGDHDDITYLEINRAFDLVIVFLMSTFILVMTINDNYYSKRYTEYMGKNYGKPRTYGGYDQTITIPIYMLGGMSWVVGIFMAIPYSVFNWVSTVTLVIPAAIHAFFVLKKSLFNPGEKGTVPLFSNFFAFREDKVKEEKAALSKVQAEKLLAPLRLKAVDDYCSMLRTVNSKSNIEGYAYAQIMDMDETKIKRLVAPAKFQSRLKETDEQDYNNFVLDIFGIDEEHTELYLGSRSTSASHV